MTTRDRKPGGASRFAYDGLDRLIHERARLSLLSSLATHSNGLAFAELKDLCALTDGNLNRHLLVLEAARLVSIAKTPDGSRTQTRCRISAAGRRRYLEYLAVLEQVIVDGAAAKGAPAGSRGRDPANA
ncbi:MAG TPA: transcriptional regulator [Steroidobacteraceae bacterium]|nr:transcriptional regulator [Steroidobacteraceae bacterium]